MVKQKELFGGAIVADFPENFIDASVLRQVPDNQEVFLHRDSNISIVIEVLQRVEEENDEEAVKFHFQALAHDNDATSSTMQLPIVVHVDQVDQPSPIVMRGTQKIRKFNANIADDVDILIALFRVHFKRKSADLVVTESIPRGTKGGGSLEPITDQFDLLVSSLRIVDYDLFADGPVHS